MYGLIKKKTGIAPKSDKYDLPNMANCLAANKSRRENEHINAMVFHDEYYRERMRNIQATYKVKQDNSPGLGYTSRIRLIWDHDRLLGTFDLDVFNGSFVIDPGPGQDHFKADVEYSKFHEALAKDKESSEESADDDDDGGDDEIAATKEYRFKWRGTNAKIPHKSFNSAFTIGKIRFGNGKIWGHFEAMSGVGYPGGRCEFHGKIPHGPCLVDMSVQEFIDKWNGYAETEEDEIPRSPTPRSTIAKSPSEHDDTYSTGSLMDDTSQLKEWTEKDQQSFIEMITGIYDITSREIEEDWLSTSKGLMARLHVDQQQGKVLGYFDIGIVEGFLCLNDSLEALTHNSPMEFKWYGRGTFSGSTEQGTGTLAIRSRGARTVQGMFYDMPDKNDGQVDFHGMRRLLPAGVSGRGSGYYRAQWEEYNCKKSELPQATATATATATAHKGRWGVRQELAKRVSWKRSGESG
ncbi:2146baa4-320f-46d1-860e-117774cd1eae-CDS [Sclerotinia trifoliorum]|uniref:2146baa4-320f-46d1-860e-117774cd1eae-CDS n=1 Tax=Sclerotinia trifoliorum TaxID=28548 RepID=A0A8H2VZ30_9HELO|nr:2146baa4-320f-46d1-860e-117774cd1eae-CDS [Sclerotinia trifoliorum]